MSDDLTKQYVREMKEMFWRMMSRQVSTFASDTLRGMGMTGRLVLLLWHILASAWLVTLGVISAVLIFGTYVVVTLQALWSPLLGTADILLPVKLALATGYGVLFLHVGSRIHACLRGRELAGALATVFELALFIGPLVALRTSISEFLSRGSFIYLGEGVLPWEVRTISTFAYSLPVVFLLGASATVWIIVKIRRVLAKIRKKITEEIPDENLREMLRRMTELFEKWQEVEQGRVQPRR
jgi:hypothetical protein